MSQPTTENGKAGGDGDDGTVRIGSASVSHPLQPPPATPIGDRDRGSVDPITTNPRMRTPQHQQERQKNKIHSPSAVDGKLSSPDNDMESMSNKSLDDRVDRGAEDIRNQLQMPSGGNRRARMSPMSIESEPAVNGSSNSFHGDDRFEDEHDASVVQTPRRSIASPLSQRSSLASPGGSVADDEAAAAYAAQEKQDKAFVENFWTAYDEILILSLFTQVGILCRLSAAYFFRIFGNVFSSDSALFVQLPLNCLSCFVMGLLCSGESLMEIVCTRFTPPRLQRDLHRDAVHQSREEDHDDEHYYEEDATSYNHEEMTEMRVNGIERNGWRQRRRQRRNKRNRNADRRKRHRPSSSLVQQRHHQQAQNPDVYNELREVQLLAWERRIRASVCLLLFPVKKEDVDIVETYFSEGNQRERGLQYTEREGEERREDVRLDVIDEHDAVLSNNENNSSISSIGGFDDLIFEEEIDNSSRENPVMVTPRRRTTATINAQPNTSGSGEEPHVRVNENTNTPEQGNVYARGNVHFAARQYGQLDGGNIVDYGTQENPDFDQIISNVATGVSNNISLISRVNLANGWDVGTSPQEKSEDLTLGLRDGLCGALSSFSSWISSMVNLLKLGQIDKAVVGLMLGIQLPILAYRFGQYVSVYIFVWRCRREKGQDEKRGYGIQLHTADEENPTNDVVNSPNNLQRNSFDSADSQRITRTKGRRTVHDEENEMPSIRAIFTALFIMCLVAQLTSLTFFDKPEDRLLSLSLLFSPLGVLARWRMMKFNTWRPSFPLGTFACNVTACALSGTLGTLLAGNPGPRERIALVSVVAGFGGTLSSVARFIVEILSLMDPILFRLDGLYYAIISVCAGLLVSYLSAASVDWADSIE